MNLLQHVLVVLPSALPKPVARWGKGVMKTLRRKTHDEYALKHLPIHGHYFHFFEGDRDVPAFAVNKVILDFDGHFLLFNALPHWRCYVTSLHATNVELPMLYRFIYIYSIFWILSNAARGMLLRNMGRCNAYGWEPCTRCSDRESDVWICMAGP
jgi:hypothetical protein